MSKILPSLLFVGVMIFTVKVSAVTGPTMVQTSHVVLWYSGVDQDTATKVAEGAQAAWAPNGDEDVKVIEMRLTQSENDGIKLILDDVNLERITPELHNLFYRFLRSIGDENFPGETVAYGMSNGIGGNMVMDGFKEMDQPSLKTDQAQ